MPALLQQGQGVGLGLCGAGETLRAGLAAQREGRRLAAFGVGDLGLWVVHGETPRRVEIDGRQVGLAFVRRGVFWVHRYLWAPWQGALLTG
ncbi:hypothetical protein D3C78_1578100 [compost metagenome]